MSIVKIAFCTHVNRYFWLLMYISLDYRIVYVFANTIYGNEKANKLFAIILSCYNQMSHSHVSMFP